MSEWLPSLAWNVAAVTGAVVWGGVAVAGVARGWSAVREWARVDVSDRWIVVTGCDSGLGQGLIGELIDRNARVVALCFTEQGAQAALERGAALAPQVDLTDDARVMAVAAEIQTACDGALWGLVHNAGVVLPGFVEYVPHAYYRRVMDVNFFAPVLLTQRLLPCLRQGSGRVVLVSSVDGLVSLPGNAPYDASKFAIEAYADALRCELSLWDLPVSVINPATLRTPLAMRFFDAHLSTWDDMDRADPDGSWKQVWPRDWAQEYATFNAGRLDSIAQNPRHAVRDMVHALTARRPKLRYLSGTLAKTVFRALWWAPEGWALAFKRSTIKPRPPSTKRRA